MMSTTELKYPSHHIISGDWLSVWLIAGHINPDHLEKGVFPTVKLSFHALPILDSLEVS